MKFINKRTGVILEPRNETVLEQLQKGSEYDIYEEQKNVKNPQGKKKVAD